jgi:hypothetical protein
VSITRRQERQIVLALQKLAAAERLIRESRQVLRQLRPARATTRRGATMGQSDKYADGEAPADPQPEQPATDDAAEAAPTTDRPTAEEPGV